MNDTEKLKAYEEAVQASLECAIEHLVAGAGWATSQGLHLVYEFLSDVKSKMAGDLPMQESQRYRYERWLNPVKPDDRQVFLDAIKQFLEEKEKRSESGDEASVV